MILNKFYFSLALTLLFLCWNSRKAVTKFTYIFEMKTEKKKFRDETGNIVVNCHIVSSDRKTFIARGISNNEVDNCLS